MNLTNLRNNKVVGGVILAAAGVASVVGVVLSNGGSGIVNCDVNDFGNDAVELEFLDLINEYRAENGVGSLQVSDTLNRPATWMAKDLISNNYFSHTDSLGRSPYARGVDCGVSGGMGENLAAGFAWDTAQEVLNAWKDSSGHNATMLSPYFRSIGIAREQGGGYGWYWVTNFSSRDGSVDITPVLPTNTPNPTPRITATSTSDRVIHTIFITDNGFSPSTCFLDRMDGFRFQNKTNIVQDVFPVNMSSRLQARNLAPNEVSRTFNFPFIGSLEFYVQRMPDHIGRITTDRGRDCVDTGFATATPVIPRTTATAQPTQVQPTPTATEFVRPTNVPKPTATPQPAISWGVLNGPTLVTWQNEDLLLSRAPANILSVDSIYHWTGNEWVRWNFGSPSYTKSLEVLEKGKQYWVIPKLNQ